MKKLLFTIIFVLPILSCIAQENSNLKKCVAFIFSLNSKGEYQPRGTGYFVSVPTKKDTTKSFIYFVTAKHVIQNKDKTFRNSIYLRLNLTTDSSEFVQVPLITFPDRYFEIHQDSTVDLAVILLPAIKLNKYDHLSIPISMLSTKSFVSQNHIREGDEVFFCGLFLNYFGKQRNYPLFRFGKVALIPEERVPFEGNYSFLYLLETTSFGGNSGSPVFFKLSPNRDTGNLIVGAQTQYYLAGTMRGYYGATIDTAYTRTETSNFILFQNAGIAAVVPAYQLIDIINDISKIIDK